MKESTQDRRQSWNQMKVLNSVVVAVPTVGTRTTATRTRDVATGHEGIDGVLIADLGPACHPAKQERGPPGAQPEPDGLPTVDVPVPPVALGCLEW